AGHVRAVVLNVLSRPERFRLVAKELFYALLTGPRPPGEPELAIATVRDCFSGIKEFLTWADQRGMPTLAALTSQDLAAYQQHLVARRLSVSRRGRLRRHARLFWIYRAVLAADRLGVDPAGLDGW